jgi:uncharacterized protein YndB with AHSA1/START domain
MPGLDLSIEIAAPPTLVMRAFFDPDALGAWWSVARSVTTPRVLGPYVVEWRPTDFRDEIIGRLGGVFRGTIMQFEAGRGFFVADAFWLPPDGDPIGPMALEVQARPHGNGRETMLTVRQSGEGEGPRWQRYFQIMGHGWEGALAELKNFMDLEAQRTRRSD